MHIELCSEKMASHTTQIKTRQVTCGTAGLKKLKSAISKTSTVNPRFAAGGESPVSKTESTSAAPATDIKMKSDPLNLNNLYPRNDYLLEFIHAGYVCRNGPDG
jgi:hypothetical protein